MAKKGAGAAITEATRILVLYGQDSMVMAEHLERLRSAMTEDGEPPETFRFDGRSASLAEVLDEARSFSLMGGRKLVIVDHADKFVQSHRGHLERYAESPPEHAALVLRAERWNKGNLDKRIASCGAVIKCESPKPADAQRWAVERAREAHGYELDRRTAGALVERLGPDLGRLDQEVAKIGLILDEKGKPDPELLDQLVGRSSDETAWAIQDELVGAWAQTLRAPSEAASATERTIGKIRELIGLASQPDLVVAFAALDLSRKLYLAAAMREAGRDRGAAAKELRLWGLSVEAFFDVASGLGLLGAGELLDTAVELDRRAKSGLGDHPRNLEAWCVAVSDKLKVAAKAGRPAGSRR